MSTSLILLRSRPPRGIVARCREGGAGCGTRERDATHVTSPGGGGEPSRGTKTAGRSDRSVEGVKPEMPRGAPSWRGASADAPGPGDPGPPGVIVRAVRRNPDNASSRRVTPSLGKGKRDGPTPSPIKPGGETAWLYDFEYVSDCTRRSPGKRGRLRADERNASGAAIHVAFHTACTPTPTLDSCHQLRDRPHSAYASRKKSQDQFR